MKITAQTDVAAPAGQVWAIVGPGFADVGVWASVITHSEPTATGDGRRCSITGIPQVDRVVERLVAYDDAARTLTYAADTGLPGYVRHATNTWTVTPLRADRSRVTVDARVTLSGLAWLAAPLIRVTLWAVARRTLRDLRRHVEHGAHGRLRIRWAPATGATPVTLRADRLLASSPAEVWDAVADAAGYARFAAGIAATDIVSGAGEGMVRVCTNDRGDQWSETCTLWEPGHRYRMSVDVATYPPRYRMLIDELTQTWSVEPVHGGTQLTLTFEARVKLGIVGRLAVRVLGRPSRLEAILAAYERELMARHDASVDPSTVP